jgi:hypothetical protein
MTLLGKVLPLQVGGDPNGTPISVGLTIEQQREQARREIARGIPVRGVRFRGDRRGRLLIVATCCARSSSSCATDLEAKRRPNRQ